jgi:GNAT superfamily N-acetyltransferase
LQLLGQFRVETGLSMPDTAALDRLESALRQDRIRYYLALAEPGAVGVVSLTVSFSTFAMRPYGVIGDLYVHPGHRGRGCAANLLIAALDGAHEAGCAFVATSSAAGMEGLFQRIGFVPAGAVHQRDIDLGGPPPSLAVTGEWKLSWD